MAFKVPNQHRFKEGPFKTSNEDGNNGFFVIPFVKKVGKSGKMEYYMMCIVSDKLGWDRVSVYIIDKKGNTIPRTPIWEEMEAVRNYFWDETDEVIQYQNMNNEKQQNPYMLHMWKPQLTIFAKPPKEVIIS